MNIFLENERGERMRSIYDTENRLMKKIFSRKEAMRLLKYVDPYGATVFNHVQIDDLIWDLDDLAMETGKGEDLTVLSAVRSLANEVKATRHLYVRMVGD